MVLHATQKETTYLPVTFFTQQSTRLEPDKTVPIEAPRQTWQLCFTVQLIQWMSLHPAMTGNVESQEDTSGSQQWVVMAWEMGDTEQRNNVLRPVGTKCLTVLAVFINMGGSSQNKALDWNWRCCSYVVPQIYRKICVCEWVNIYLLAVCLCWRAQKW